MIKKWMTLLLVVMMIASGCQKEVRIVGDQTSDEPTVSMVEQDVPDDVEEGDVPEPELESPAVNVLEEATDAAREEADDERPDDTAAADEAEDARDETASTDQDEGKDLIMFNAPLSNGRQASEIKGLWLTYLDLLPIFESGGEDVYRKSMKTIIEDAKSLGLNTLMYQVRPFGDALYVSDLFPTSYVITGREGEPLTYDPFGIAVQMAHAEGLRIEAWINPYRVRTAGSTIPLADDNEAKKWLEDGSRRVLTAADGTIVYNPSNEEAQERIIAGVEEIIARYPVDGIHFDDYFYPTAQLGFDEVEFLGFLHDSDGLSHEDWRRYNVNRLIRLVYESIHRANRDIVFGISPQGDIDVNYNQLFADVSLWLSVKGYVDYVIPQIYFGFEHQRLPYAETLQAWHDLNRIGVDVIPGLAAYKVGQEDPWAGEGVEEWVVSEGILSQMIHEAKKFEDYSGYALFRYDYLFHPTEDMADRMTLELDRIIKED